MIRHFACTGETYKSVVKLTFAKGASLKDPAKLFNSSLEGNTRRAIDIREGEKVDADAFKALVRAAVALNTSGGKKKRRRMMPSPACTTSSLALHVARAMTSRSAAAPIRSATGERTASNRHLGSRNGRLLED
jgi:hypothetical protein